LKRGDTVTVAAGSGYGSKPRPALVVQGDALAEMNSVILALFTTTDTTASRLRPRIDPDARNGLRAPSDLMADILITVPRDRVGGVIGHLSVADMARVETALLTVLGFAR
jgi:mRNA interferase MazF